MFNHDIYDNTLIPTIFLFQFDTGNRIMNYDVPKNQLYPLRLKGLSICFTMLKAALSGNYVNFGVCKLYGDETLDNVLDVTTKLILTIPQSDLLVNLLKIESLNDLF